MRLKTNTLPNPAQKTTRNYFGGGRLRLLAATFAATLLGLSAIAQTYLTPDDEYQFLCDKDEIMVQLINTDPSMQVDLISTSGISLPGFWYDPGTGELYISGLALTGPKSYGQYNFDLLGADYRFTIFLIECCGKTDFDLIIVTEVASALPAINGLDVLILDDLRINQTTDIDNSQVYFGADAKISVNAGEDLNIRTSALQRYCEYRWDGIIAESYPTRIEFSSSSIEGSARGFLITQDTEFQGIESTWDNNTIGIGIFDVTASGSYLNNSYIDLDGNYFDFSSSSTISLHPSTTVNMSAYSTGLGIGTGGSQAIHVYVENSEVQLGDPNNQRNDFYASGIDLGIAMFSKEATVGAANNLFFMIQYGIYAIDSKLDVGGSSSAWLNTFNQSKFYSEESKQKIYRNTFLSTTIEILTPDKYYIGTNAGTDIQLNNLTSVSCTINQSTQDVKKVMVDNNVFKNSYLISNNVTSNSLTDGFVITNNEFATNIALSYTADQTEPSYYQVQLTNCHGVRVGTNVFNLMPTLETPDSYRNGIYINNCNRGQFKSNDFYQRTVCIFGTDSLLDTTTFSCNYFEDFIYGFYFKDALVFDQGSSAFGVDNVWDEQSLSVTRFYLFDVSPQFDYNYSGTAATNLDPYFGSGVIQNMATLNDIPFAAQNSNCSDLNKKDVDVANMREYKIALYPNPAATYFRIDGEFDIIKEIEIFSITGKKLKHFINVNPNSEIEINLPNGMYLVQLRIESKQVVHKLIVD